MKENGNLRSTLRKLVRFLSISSAAADAGLGLDFGQGEELLGILQQGHRRCIPSPNEAGDSPKRDYGLHGSHGMSSASVVI